ncbi:hypothetical protein ACWELB_20565 [Streptomyces asiaticus]
MAGREHSRPATGPWRGRTRWAGTRREHLRFADEVERLGGMAGSAISTAQAELAADKHRELAERFSGPRRAE